MSNSLLHLTASNLFVGSNVDASQALVLKSQSLPKLTEKTKDFSPGGGPMDIELMLMKLEKLTSQFKLEGANPSVMSKFMSGRQELYTARGNLFDVSTQTNVGIMALMRGKMSEVDMGDIGGDDGMETSYQITEIMHYEVAFDGQEKYYFDFLEGYRGIRIDGVPVYADVARNLGL